MLCCSSFAQNGDMNLQDLKRVVQRLDNGEQIDKLDVEFRDILYDINRSDLSKSDESYLLQIAEIMLRSDRVVFEINAHSCPFTDEFEDRLSADRSFEIKELLLDQGIDPDRIKVNNLSNKFPLIQSDSVDTSLNRRVEISFIPTVLADYLDVIVLKSGEEISGRVTTANVEVVKYRDSNNKVRKFRTEEVKEVRFQDGDVLVFDKGENEPKEQSVKQNKIRTKKSGDVSDSDKIKRIFSGINFKGKKLRLREPDIFGKNVLIVQGAYNIKSNLGPNYKLRESKTSFPRLSATIEYGLFKNVGIGITAGLEKWGINPLEFEYTYSSIGVRAAFHIALHPSVDPYFGIGANYRTVSFVNDPELCGEDWAGFRHEQSNSSWGFDPFIGIRVFLNDRVGMFGEIGSDALSFYKLGFQYVLVKKYNRKNKVL